MKPIIQTALRDLSNRDQLGKYLPANGKFVEVGVLRGDFSAHMLKTWGGHVYCVDPWINQPRSDYFDGANLLDMNRIFQQVQAGIGKNPRCTLVRMKSLNAVSKFDDGELDGVYLDGNHAVDEVRAEIAAWWPKLKIGGILSGHDCNTRYDHETNSDAGTAVLEFCEAIGVRPHLNWCTSWHVQKTEELDKRFRAACIAGDIARPVYTDNSKIDVAVVLPVAKFEWHLACKWLRWAAALMKPEFEFYNLIIYCSPDLRLEQMQALKAVTMIDEWDVKVVCAEQVKELGYFGTPNQMVKGALELVEKEYPEAAMLWCEADTVPLRASWVREILTEYRACGRPFMGDFYRAGGSIPHMTGNAVYHPSWRTLAPSLAALKQEECGWDSLCAHDTMPRAHNSKTIQQIWRPPLPITADWARANIRPETALFHQCKDGSLIDVLCEQVGIEKIPLAPALCESTYATQKHGDIIANGFFVPPATPGLAAPSAVIDATPIPSRPIPGMEILIVTFMRDLPFLRYCLKSIEKFARGFSGVTLVVPAHEKGHYDWVPAPIRVRYFDEVPGKGMLGHMVQVCRADQHCPEAESILHLDADCMFWQPVTPQDYAPGGRLLMVREAYAQIFNPNRHLWRKAVKEAIGLETDFDTMVRHPQVYPREVYAKAREMTEAHTGRKFDEYVLSGRNQFPQEFCEHVTLGTVAINFYADRYHFIDYDHDKDGRECGIPQGQAFQYVYRYHRDRLIETWSHASVDSYRALYDDILKDKHPAYVMK